MPHLKCTSSRCQTERRGTLHVREHSICKAKENQDGVWMLPGGFARESLRLKTLVNVA